VNRSESDLHSTERNSIGRSSSREKSHTFTLLGKGHRALLPFLANVPTRNCSILLELNCYLCYCYNVLNVCEHLDLSDYSDYK
jgi:hypothetical protein